MNRDKHHDHRIEELLRQIPELERSLSSAKEETTRISLEKSLKHRRKRFEFLIPYQFRRQLRNMCKDAGIRGEFM
jgi:regulator of replication initiation timing